MADTVDINDPAPVDSTPEIDTPERYEDLFDSTPVEDKPAPVSEVPSDAPDAEADVEWDEDEDAADGSAPPDVDEDKTDEELKEIEDRNKWMKGRLAPVKSKLTAAERENARLKAELEAFRSGQPAAAPRVRTEDPVKDILSQDPTLQALNAKLAELSAKKDEMTEGDYVDQRLDLVSDIKSRSAVIRYAVETAARSQVQAVAQEEAQIGNAWSETVLAAKDTYPDIAAAKARLEKNVEKLHVDIRRALVLDEDKGGINPAAADLVHIIGTDKKALTYLVAQSQIAAKTGRTPVAALEYIGRLKARTAKADAAPDQVRTPERPTTKRATLPRAVRSVSTSEPIDLDAWADQALARGERPW